MKSLKIETNIDKLKLCYIQPIGFFENLKESFLKTDKRILNYSNYHLFLEETENNAENEIVKMLVSVNYTMDDMSHRLGRFEFSITGKYTGFCFFTFENKTFYTLYEKIMDYKYNTMLFIETVTEDLGLKFNNVTLCEICLDTNKNLISALRRYIKNYDEYEMFLNGNLVREEDRTLDNYGEYFTRSRKKMNRQPTLYLHQKKQSGLALKVYNKSKELEESGKDYINKWLDFGNQTIFRAELTIRNTDLREYCNQTRDEQENLISLLSYNKWRNQLWAYSVRRLIYFRSRVTGDEIGLIDML